MQRPGLAKKTPTTFSQIETLAAVIGFVDQFLLNKTPRQPSPVS
jgi:hypothetical protein